LAAFLGEFEKHPRKYRIMYCHKLLATQFRTKRKKMATKSLSVQSRGVVGGTERS
jgi:hypothetical protein